MRKLLIVLFLLISAFSHTNAAEPEGYDYYPLTFAMRWSYEVSQVDGKGKTFIQEVSVPGTDTYKKDQYIILEQKDKRGTIRSFVIKDKSGVYWKKIGASKTFTPEASSVFTPPIPLMKFPLKVGTAWNWEGNLKIAFINKNINMRCEVVAEEEITVPAGTFKCLKIHIHQLRNKEESNEYSWYAPGIGQIKYIGKELQKELTAYSLPK
ncbi:MAG: hypothetical protein ABH868_01240 [bacterium]